ncbi:MAG: nitronate monooxygenase, partial [Cyclobacteriaceae bacterium]
FKMRVIESREGDTHLTLKQLTPVRLLRNDFFQQVQEAEARGASKDELMQLLGRGRAKRGIFEGDLSEGELEIGQVAAAIRDVQPAAEILKNLWEEYREARQKIASD